MHALLKLVKPGHARVVQSHDFPIEHARFAMHGTVQTRQFRKLIAHIQLIAHETNRVPWLSAKCQHAHAVPFEFKTPLPEVMGHRGERG